MNESKIFLSFCDIIDSDRNLPLGEFRSTFENVKALAYGTVSIEVLNELIKSVKKGATQKIVGFSLLLVTTSIETFKFFQKQFQIKDIPFLANTANELGSYSVFKGDYNPLNYTLNKPKEAFYLMYCCWNISCDAVKYIVTGSAQDRVKLLNTKNVISRICDVGKILMITLSPNYATDTAFKVMGLSLNILAQLKEIAYN